MISFLSGKILEAVDGKITLGVGSQDTGVVGYAVTTPQSQDYLDFIPGKAASFYIYTHVREDSLDLYGFRTSSEKILYLTLLSVTGIGPKGALTILSSANSSDLVRAIAEKDRDYLFQIPGIGKKTAERLIIELSDSIRKKIESGLFFAKALGPKSSGLSFGTGNPGYDDARAALLGLGYRDQDVSALLRIILSENDSFRTEDLIRTALQQMA